MLHFDKAVVVLDFETTGTDPSSDRIVQYSFLKILPSGEEIQKKGYLNPKRPIPAESTAIHGITDETVKDAPTFGQFAKGMREFIGDCILAGYNIKKFDLPLLFEEFKRVAIDWDPMSHEIYDSFEILTSNESRTLGWALRFYCGQEIDGAHDAEVDVLATRKILQAQIQKYAITEPPKSKNLDLEGVIQVDDEGDYIYGIGKDKKGNRRQHLGFLVFVFLGICNGAERIDDFLVESISDSKYFLIHICIIRLCARNKSFLRF